MPIPTTTLQPIDESAALGLLAGRGSWRQYPAYAAMAARRVGATSHYVAMVRGDEPFAVANLRQKRVPLLGTTTLVSHGPALLRDAAHWDEDRAAAIALLRGAAGIGELLIDPDLGWTMAGLSDLSIGEAEPSLRPYRTIVVDISGEEAEIRRRFEAKWRGHLNKGEREGLEIVVSHDPADFHAIAPLLADTAQRKGFGVIQDCAFFAEVAARSSGEERYIAHLVRRDGELLSGHIGAYAGGMAVYLIGATSPRGRDLRASYVAQWAVIRTAKSLGISHYDLCGIDPEANEAVWHFKARMGGVDISTPGGRCLPAGGLGGKALTMARRLYQRHR